MHHVALLSSDVGRTIDFYQGLLEFPLSELFENRDYRGSTHFFFDIGIGNQLAFFDLPGLDLGPYAEVLGGLHHLAISVEPERWQHLKDKLDDAGVEYAHIDGTSIYFQGPDGERIELISGPARRDVRAVPAVSGAPSSDGLDLVGGPPQHRGGARLRGPTRAR